MRYLELEGHRLSVIGLGCWQFGERHWGYGSEYSEADALAVIRRALELGVTVLDTAELYGRGRSERLVGAGLQGYEGERFLATKFLPILPTPSVMTSHCQRSLERLQVPQVELYQIHKPNPAVPLRVQMEGLRRILGLGLSRYAGVSTYSLRRWRAAERHLGAPVISNQVRYNLLDRGPESDLIPYAQRRRRLVIAYSPLAQGLLSGRYRAGLAPPGLRRANPLFTDAGLDAAQPLLETLRQVADAHRCPPSQVALAYLIAQPQVIVIPGAKSLAQLESNVAAAELRLGQDELGALRQSSDRFRQSRVRTALQLAARLVHSRSAPNRA
ncbi:MAG: aldo/keto reductase [Candidatus Dormibacteria bacterium]